VMRRLARVRWAFLFIATALAAEVGGTIAIAFGANQTQETDAAVHAANTVRTVTLPHFEPELPMAPGREVYLTVCVSCHSPRYVLMQPPFTQSQWEQTVDKMAKTYGAQMDPAQRNAIVQYLVTTHGPDSARAVARDEDSDFGYTSKPTASPEPAPLLTTLAEGAERIKQIERGAELFQQYCAACHGPTGRGDGFVAPVLWRKPKNRTRYSLELLSRALWNGRPGTTMPSWRALPQQDLSAMAAYVQSLHPPVTADAPTPESLQRGNQVFMQNCAPCHGATGDGKGTAAAALIPEPANFTLKQPDFDYILQVFRDGIPGTGMPAWQNQISEPDRKAVANFVRSLFKDGASGGQ
jgi:mono/diheme cytochrome c family protein